MRDVGKTLGLSLDEVRAEESKQLKRDGDEPVLTKSSWCLLKRLANLTDRQTVKLSEVLKYDLRSVRAHLLWEESQQFWDYVSPSWVGKFPGEWTVRDAIMSGTVEESRQDAEQL